MKNLKLQSSHHCKLAGINDGVFVTFDSITDSLYIASKNEFFIYEVASNQVNKKISLLEENCITDNDSIVSMHYLPEDNTVCMATSKGDLLLVDVNIGKIECTGSVDQGFSTAEWSPDMELLVLITGNDTFVLMTRDFDPICEIPLHTQNVGEAAQVNVGWGKKETQFHGTEGKEAAQKTKMKIASKKLDWDRGKSVITWRGDGQMFAVSSINHSENSRNIRIYNREGVLQSCNEIIDGLEDTIAWRPSGNLIVSSQRKPNKHDVIFFEKNGLQHGEFTLPYKQNEKLIIDMIWNVNSDILTILLKDKESDTYTVLLWTVGNYHWYLKQEIVIGHQKSAPRIFWDAENAFLLHIYKPDSSYDQYLYQYDIMQSYHDDNLAMVAVIDAAHLLITPFQLMIVPPPMSTYKLTANTHINTISFGTLHHRHDVIMQLADGSFQVACYEDNQFVVNSLQYCDIEGGDKQRDIQYQHINWCKPDKFVAVKSSKQGNFIVAFHLDDESWMIKLCCTLKIEEQLHSLLCSSAGDKVIIQDNAGRFYSVSDDLSGYAPLDVKLQKCSLVAYTDMSGEDVIFGLTDHFRLFMNSEEIANNCTSFLLHNEFLLVTSHSHTLRCIYLKSLFNGDRLTDNKHSFDEAVRRVERGSKIVTAVRQGTTVVLQMPRGNLETIHPRALVVTFLQKLITNLDYGRAMDIMRRNRINLNLMYDHNPKLFLDNTATFVASVNSTNHINQFLAELSDDDVCSTLYHPFYHHGNEKTQDTYRNKSCTKVDTVCNAVRSAIEELSVEKFYLSYLTTYAKQTQPDLETVLTKIKELKDNPSACSTVTCDSALKYILYLVDVNQLYDIALGLYDFHVVLMVAEKSQKDPKEYLPFLNNFKNMDTHYQRYSIDKYLKRYKKALLHLVNCEDRFNELVEFVKEHKLHRDALKLYKPSTSQHNKLSHQYAEYLTSQKLYEDAGIVYSRSGYHAEAIAVLLKTFNWHLIITEARTLKYNTGQFHKLCRDLCAHLKENRLYEAAATVLEKYLKDVEECVVCLLEGNLWFQALNVIKNYSREDLIETNFKPALLEHAEQQIEQIKEYTVTFTTHKERLKTVIETKERESMEILQGIRDDPENDLFSDTSSITGQSVTSAGSKGTRSTGRTAKSRNKAGRKKYSLRPGGKHEDFALREALTEIVNTTDMLKDGVSSMLKALVLYNYDEIALQLQTELTLLLDLIESSMEEIWQPRSVDQNTDGNQFGPQATVQSIIDQKYSNTYNNVSSNDLPKPSVPVIRKYVHWKLHLLR